MSTLIVGHFTDGEQVQRALAELPSHGFDEEEFESYYLNPPGQHGLYMLGGDASSDEGASDAGKGAATAAVIGGAAGLAIGSLGGPVGALAGAGVGAYVGSLAGALGRTHDSHPEDATVEHPVEQPAGPAVCICVDRPGSEPEAVSVLTEAGACRVDRTTGIWADGDWQDNDPRRPVEILYTRPAGAEEEPRSHPS